MMDGSKLVVVSFDLGTTYSGYAFSFIDQPLKIETNQIWNACSNRLLSLKTPTCVLLDQNKKFYSFGYEAESKFADLAEDEDHHGWFLFRWFKMILHSNEKLTETTTLEDINGNRMPAMEIFSMSIKYLKDHFLEAVKKRMDIEEKDIMYVITIPAIWKDNSKQFMRKAAEQAGIESKRLRLVYEPEAASIWCQTTTTHVEEKKYLTKPGNQFMVIDLGGGTADICVQERQIGGKLKVLRKASGGPWGATVVEDNYLKWLTRIFGVQTMKEFKKSQMDDYLDLLRDFETKKITITSELERKITLKLPTSLTNLHKEIEKVSLAKKLADLEIEELVELKLDKMRVHPSVIKKWFDVPLKSLKVHVERVLLEPDMEKVGMIILVGGFSESKYVQQYIEKAFPEKRLIIPVDASLVVLKGAVLFGHFPNIVSSRIMSYSYGLHVSQLFDEKKHHDATVKVLGGEKKAADVFDLIVRAGDIVKTGKTISKGPYVPNNSDKTVFDIYRTENKDPKYISDPDCERVGRLTISHPNGKSLVDNKLNAEFWFNDTEVFVIANNIRTGKTYSTYIDCLEGVTTQHLPE